MSRQASRGVPLGPRSVRGNAGRDAGNFVSPRETGSSVASPSRARFDSGHVWSDCRQNDPICIAPAQGLGRLSTNYGCAGGPKPAWPLTGVRFGPELTHGVSTKLSRLPRRAAAARSRSSRACAYTRSVIAGSACPSLPATVRMSTPAPISSVALKCRRSWNLNWYCCLRPVALASASSESHRRANARVKLLGVLG